MHEKIYEKIAEKHGISIDEVKKEMRAALSASVGQEVDDAYVENFIVFVAGYVKEHQ